MNIEDRLSALSAEAKSLPEQMNMERIKRRVKRRKMIHSFGTVGKIAAALFVAFSVSLGIGVNSSVVFAKSVVDVPVIGSYAQLLIVRPEIKNALKEHEDLESLVDNGRLHEVSITQPGAHSSISMTLDSFFADEIALTGFFRIDGIEGPFNPKEGYYALANMRITDRRTGEVLTVIEDLRAFDTPGDLYLNRFFWNHPAKDIDLDFDLEFVSDDYVQRTVIDSYHMELKNLDIIPAKHIELDQTVSVEGHDVHLVELLVSESGTIVTYDIPDDFDLYVLEIEITDVGREMTVSESLPGICEYIDNGVMRHILSTFFYQDIHTVRVNIVSAYCSFTYDEYVRIDPNAMTASFHSETFPVRVYTSQYSYADFGLPANDYLDSINSMMFLIPSAKVPNLTSAYFPATGEMTYDRQYPHVKIDDIDYLVIQCPSYWVNDEDGCYYLINGTEPATYPVEAGFEVEIP